MAQAHDGVLRGRMLARTKPQMSAVSNVSTGQRYHRTCFFPLLGVVVHLTCQAQIDPMKRQLLQFGYNQALEGHAPLAGYAFYYLNQPNFMHPDLTLRLALAPTYIDSEFGFNHALGPQTDLAVGIAGGGFADSYSEIRRGRFLERESFTGHDGKASISLYHRFNPDQRIPLNGIVRGIMDYIAYEEDDETADTFVLPPDHATFHLLTGLRWGGREPLLRPAMAMEMSAWYEGQLRSAHGAYGFNGDRVLEADSHRFWGRAMLAYTLPHLEHNFSVSLTAGTSLNADRFSAYRLGAALPLLREDRLDLPGYFYQEITARQFALLNGLYMLPIDSAKHWSLTAFGATAVVDYLAGLQQAGDWHAGLGAGIGYTSAKKVWQLILAYAYGFNAIRSDGRGAQSVVLLLQYDLEAHQREAYPSLAPVMEPERSRGLEHWLESIFGR